MRGFHDVVFRIEFRALGMELLAADALGLLDILGIQFALPFWGVCGIASRPDFDIEQ